ncbi:MAG: hypothetical protein K2K70_13040, partial [Lachnospiraceae bacterium]|nr:hypothetical protein [Lachnospiraceae bacterium]
VNSCSSLRQNWLAMIEQMRQLYIKAGLYKQSMDGNSLLKCLSESSQSAAKNGSVNNIYEQMNQNGNNKTFTDIAVYNMDYNITLLISDDGILTCVDEERGYLWEIPLTKSDEAKLDELIKRKMDFILRDKEVVEEYLKGNITIEDIEKWQTSTKDHGLQDSLFSSCSDEIKKAWAKAQERGGFSENLLGKDYLLTELDKYMLMNPADHEKIKTASLEDIMDLIQNMIASLKDSLELYSVSMQTTKLKELNALEKFSEELETLKS